MYAFACDGGAPPKSATRRRKLWGSVDTSGEICCLTWMRRSNATKVEFSTPPALPPNRVWQDDDPFAILRDLRFQIETVRWMVDHFDDLFDG